MRRNGMLILIAAVLIAIGGYFFLAGETAVDDTVTSTEPAVPLAPSAVGDTAVPPPAATPEPPPQDLIPSPE